MPTDKPKSPVPFLRKAIKVIIIENGKVISPVPIFRKGEKVVVIENGKVVSSPE